MKINLLSRLKSGWTLLKMIRVGLGGLILYSSVQSGHAAGIVLGGFLTAVSLFMDGACCAAGQCYLPAEPKSIKDKNTGYEELGHK